VVERPFFAGTDSLADDAVDSLIIGASIRRLGVRHTLLSDFIAFYLFCLTMRWRMLADADFALFRCDLRKNALDLCAPFWV
jgi:hypothetical protein